MAEVPRLIALDTDTDGLPDQWEWDHLGNLARSSSDDSDDDGMSNGDEWAARTSPADADSRLRLSGTGAPGGDVNLGWIGHAGVIYRIESRNALDAAAPWTSSGTDLVGYEGWQRVQAPPLVESAYYRVRVVTD